MRASYFGQIARPLATCAPQLTPALRWPLRAGEQRPPAAPLLVAKEAVPAGTATASAGPPETSVRRPTTPEKDGPARPPTSVAITPLPAFPALPENPAPVSGAPLSIQRGRALSPPPAFPQIPAPVSVPPPIQRGRALSPPAPASSPTRAAVTGQRQEPAEPQVPASPTAATQAPPQTGDASPAVASPERTITRFTAAAARDAPSAVASPERTITRLTAAARAGSVFSAKVETEPAAPPSAPAAAAAPGRSTYVAEVRSERAFPASGPAFMPAPRSAAVPPQAPPRMRSAKPANATVQIGSIEVQVAAPTPPPAAPAAPPDATPPRALSRGFASPFGLRQG